MRSLKDKVAVVTGASRGGGRGIALVLGEAGATVYVTGRSASGEFSTSGRPERIEETAELVRERGGEGVPVRVDHTVDAEVEALFERVKGERGVLDVLVNNAWGGYEKGIYSRWRSPFWKQPLEVWDRMLSAGLRSHMVSSYFAAPLLAERNEGIVVHTTAAVSVNKYHGNVSYDVVKTAITRMAWCMAHDFRPHDVAVIALAPGWMNTEVMNPTPEEREKMESVEYIGRAVVALATDPNVMEKSGQLLEVADLAREYGFTDIDGRQVPPFRELFPDAV